MEMVQKKYPYFSLSHSWSVMYKGIDHILLHHDIAGLLWCKLLQEVGFNRVFQLKCIKLLIKNIINLG